MSAISITTGGVERVPAAVMLLNKTFAQDPSLTYLLASLTPGEREARRPKLLETLLAASTTRRGASIDEAIDWKACGVLVPPDRFAPPSEPGSPSLKEDLVQQIGPDCAKRIAETLKRSNECKEKCLKEDEEYYYVYFFGTDESARGKGLCSAIARRYQDLARNENAPIYLRAGSEYALKLYEKLGFETVDEIWLGRGEAALDGTLQDGGPGFRTWGMIWRPKSGHTDC